MYLKNVHVYISSEHVHGTYLHIYIHTYKTKKIHQQKKPIKHV